MAQPHISVAAETLWNVGGLPISNSLLSTWIVMAALFIITFLVTRNLKKKPGRVQIAVELIIGGFYGFFKKLGGKYGEKFAPLVTTFFLFILFSNWFGLLPGVGTIGFFEGGAEHAQTIIKKIQAQTVAPDEHTAPGTIQEHESLGASESQEHGGVGGVVTEQEHEESAAAAEEHKTFLPIFRGPTADLNTTLALGLVAFGAIQFFGFTLAGGVYLKRFFDLRSPIYFFVGLLEIISDISKILSFGFRLFGNVFAGEVLLAIMAFLLPFLLPIPFYGLEIFVGFVQALVFAMLTTVFVNIAVAHGEHFSKHHAEEVSNVPAP